MSHTDNIPRGAADNKTPLPPDRQERERQERDRRSYAAAGRPARRAAASVVNWYGLGALYRKEVLRFLSISGQSIAAPLVTTILFYTVFTLAFGAERSLDHMSFARFLVPGLVMLAVMQNAFTNPSFSLLLAKVQGNIVDLFMPPLTAGEIVFAYALAGMTRGIVVGTVTLAGLALVAPAGVDHPLIAAFYMICAALMLSIIGLICGAICDKFDHMTAVMNFVILPLAFLSGTFYPLSRLPEEVATIARINPFFHLIDGFRYGMIGTSEGNIVIGSVTVLVVTVLLWLCSWLIIRSGFCLKM